MSLLEFKHLIKCYLAWQKIIWKFIFNNFNKYLLSDDWPKTVDVCGTEVSLGILFDSVDSKLILENLVRNNSECTGFLMWFLVFCMTFFFKPTKRSKYVYSLLIFNGSQMPLIEYTKTVNSTASLFAAISNIQKSYNGLQSHWKVLEFQPLASAGTYPYMVIYYFDCCLVF